MRLRGEILVKSLQELLQNESHCWSQEPSLSPIFCLLWTLSLVFVLTLSFTCVLPFIWEHLEERSLFSSAVEPWLKTTFHRCWHIFSKTWPKFHLAVVLKWYSTCNVSSCQLIHFRLQDGCQRLACRGLKESFWETDLYVFLLKQERTDAALCLVMDFCVFWSFWLNLVEHLCLNILFRVSWSLFWCLVFRCSLPCHPCL